MSIVLRHVNLFPRDLSPERVDELLAEYRQRLEDPALEAPLHWYAELQALVADREVAA
jgi:hypothetical protein